MLLVATFLLSALLSFALSLTVAALVGPGPFGRYSIALSLAFVLTTGTFEWLRLATTRFYSERTRSADPNIRATLDRAYLATALVLAGVTGLVAVFASDRLDGAGLSPALLAAATAGAIGTGLSDYRVALARSRFRDGLYAAIVIGRGLAAFVAAVGLAWLVGAPAAILSGWAVGLVGVAFAAGGPLADPSGGRATRSVLRLFARYALPLVAASAVYQLLPFLNRTLLAARAGYVEAGYFSLASEIAARLFQNLGAALDIALFQLAVRVGEREGAAAAVRQVERNLAVTITLLVPTAAGLLAVWPSFEALFVPVAFRGHIESVAQGVIPAFALFALALYALNPLFQIRHRTIVVVAASLVALATDLALLLLQPDLIEPAAIARVQLVALAAAVLVLVGLAARAGGRLPWRDAAVSLGSAGIMTAALWSWRTAFPPLPGLLLQVGAGGIVYGALALAFDLCGARTIVARAVADVRKR